MTGLPMPASVSTTSRWAALIKYDRFGRNLREFLNITDQLKQCKVGVTSLSEDFNTTTPAGEAMLANLVNFSEFERKTIAARVADAGTGSIEKAGRYSALFPCATNRCWHLWLNTSIFGVSKPWKQLCRRRFHLRHLYCWTLLEATPGFEPGNQGFADPCLTTWLCRRIENRSKKNIAPVLICGAGDGARTRYLHLGKVALYQMSYARKMVPPVGIEPTTRGFSVRCSTN